MRGYFWDNLTIGTPFFMEASEFESCLPIYFKKVSDKHYICLNRGDKIPVRIRWDLEDRLVFPTTLPEVFSDG